MLKVGENVIEAFMDLEDCAELVLIGWLLEDFVLMVEAGSQAEAGWSEMYWVVKALRFRQLGAGS